MPTSKKRTQDPIDGNRIDQTCLLHDLYVQFRQEFSNGNQVVPVNLPPALLRRIEEVLPQRVFSEVSCTTMAQEIAVSLVYGLSFGGYEDDMSTIYLEQPHKNLQEPKQPENPSRVVPGRLEAVVFTFVLNIKRLRLNSAIWGGLFLFLITPTTFWCRSYHLWTLGMHIDPN